MPGSRKVAVLLTLGALAAPLAACGENDARDQMDQARKEVREKAIELKGNIDDLAMLERERPEGGGD